MVLYEMFADRVPFQGLGTRDDTMTAIVEGTRPPLPDIMPPELRAMVTEAWHNDPAKRPTAAEMLEVVQEQLHERVAAGSFCKPRETAAATASAEEIAAAAAVEPA